MEYKDIDEIVPALTKLTFHRERQHIDRQSQREHEQNENTILICRGGITSCWERENRKVFFMYM